MNRKRLVRWIVITVSAPLLLIALVFGAITILQFNLRRERAAWKVTALPELDGMPLNGRQVLAEIDQIRHPTPTFDCGWTNDHVILMKNGEYLVYVWRHGSNAGLVDHLFLAHGNDGKWYYSTYHFCNLMAAILGDDPAESIAEFAKRYSLREFDGKSDECLKHTCP